MEVQPSIFEIDEPLVVHVFGNVAISHFLGFCVRKQQLNIKTLTLSGHRKRLPRGMIGFCHPS